MRFAELFRLVFWLAATSTFCVSDDSCLHFKDNRTSFTVERGVTFPLTFSLAESCRATAAGLESIVVSNVTTGSSTTGYCLFLHNDGRCINSGLAQSCSCNPDTGEYTVYIDVSGWNGEVWKVAGQHSRSRQNFEYFVNLKLKGEAQIGFLSFNGSTFTVAENTTATLAFSLTTPSTEDLSLHTLESVSIGRFGPSSDFIPRCQIPYRNGTCTNPSQENCTCDPITGRYELTTWVDRQLQHSQWAVRLDFGQGEESAERHFSINVTYAPEIEDLAMMVEGRAVQFVEEGATVTLTCSLDQGNPPRTATFFDHSRSELVPRVTADGDAMQIEHVIDGVQCQDSGLIRCEAEGATVNKSALMLVQCPPTFPTKQSRHEYIIVSGEELVADFPMQAHTISVKTSKLESINKGTVARCGERQSRCEVRIEGSPPSLTAILTLSDVTSHDQGGWRLEVTNDVGTGHVDLRLTVLPSDDKYMLLAIGGGAVVLLLTAGFIVCAVLHKARGRRERYIADNKAPDTRQERELMDVTSPPSFTATQDSLRISTDNPYDDIMEDVEERTYCRATPDLASHDPPHPVTSSGAANLPPAPPLPTGHPSSPPVTCSSVTAPTVTTTQSPAPPNPLPAAVSATAADDAYYLTPITPQDRKGDEMGASVHPPSYCEIE